LTRFYFDLQVDDESPSEDEEGIELDDADAAHLEAARTLCDLSGETVRLLKQLQTRAIIVRDEHGPLFRAEITFRNLRPH
jgi:hypothetical protein